MKGATEELSTTVIAVVAIAAIAAIFTVFLLPTLRSQIALTQACNNGPGYVAKNDDGIKTVECFGLGQKGAPGGSWKCFAYDGKGTNPKEIGSKTCTQK